MLEEELSTIKKKERDNTRDLEENSESCKEVEEELEKAKRLQQKLRKLQKRREDLILSTSVIARRRRILEGKLKGIEEVVDLQFAVQTTLKRQGYDRESERKGQGCGLQDVTEKMGTAGDGTMDDEARSWAGA
ncbi:hypothetical protein MMC30_001944 [Trapelia coarctata]|nr:hypothetical protein [Trapelia coarctata]